MMPRRREAPVGVARTCPFGETDKRLVGNDIIAIKWSGQSELPHAVGSRGFRPACIGTKRVKLKKMCVRGRCESQRERMEVRSCAMTGYGAKRGRC
jgi:hypothetical protein